MKIKKEDRCPLCGKELDYLYGDMVCTECGYRKSYGASAYEQARKTAEQAQEPKDSMPSDEIKPIGVHTTISDTTVSDTKPQKPKKKLKVWKIILVILGINLFLTILSNVMIGVYSIISDKKEHNTVSSEISAHKFPEPVESILESEVMENEPEEKSDMMRLLLTEIFHKDYKQVTDEDLSTVISLDFSYGIHNCRIVNYILADGTTGFVSLGDIYFDGSQLSLFKGLESLKLEYGSLGFEDLKGLNYLTEIWSDKTPNEVAEMTDPLQITSLGITDTIFAQSLSGIERFPNLTSLYVDGYFLNSIDNLASLNNLKKLTLENADSVKNYSVLYVIPQLESLSIESKGLRDIGFVTHMLDLKELCIQNSDIISIDVLADRIDTLEKLDLSCNYKVADYSIVSKMTHLSELTLKVSYDTEQEMHLPDLSGLSELTKLSVGNYDHFEQFINVPGLEELTLSDVYISELPEINGLINLKVLNLIDMSVGAEVIEDIRKMEQIERIDLEDSYIWGDMAGLLTMPSLHELSMEYCSANFDFNKLQINDQLEVFNLNHAILKKYEEGVNAYHLSDEEEINIAEHTDMFAYYPGLRELYLESRQIQDISFAESLTRLQILDIYDNYVTDLLPLAGLPDLKLVMCESNPIVNDAGLGSKINRD